MSTRTQGRDDETENILIHTPAMDEDDEAACLDFLTATPPRQSNVLIISYNDDPDTWMRRWLDHAGHQPAQFGFIQVGGTTRSATAVGTPIDDQAMHPDFGIEIVSDPHDLTGLGITISEFLSQWDGNAQQTAVCFDSLTALLQYTDGVQSAFRFLHTLVGRIQTARARACYTITPDAHDAQTVATLTTLFDDVRESATHT